MKNFKTLTVAALLTGAAFTLNSCGGGETSTDDKKEDKKEAVSLDSGYGCVQQLINGLDGEVKMDKATSKDIQKYFDFEDDDEEYLSADKNFAGYSFNRSFTLVDGVLNSVSYSTFYDDDKKIDAKKDSKEILELLKEKFGESGDDSFHDWETDDYTISFNVFDDGYSMYVDSYIEEEIDEPEGGESCVGDFYGLKNDLRDLFMTNIANGSIKIGKTTEDEMKTLTGDATGFTKEYDGLSVSGYYSFDGGTLSSFTLDYFYNDCQGAITLLDADKGDICELVNETLGGSESFDDGGNDWSIDGQTVSQMNFSDGYSISLD